MVVIAASRRQPSSLTPSSCIKGVFTDCTEQVTSSRLFFPTTMNVKLGLRLRESAAQLRSKAGVPRAFPHLFRHTFATQLLSDGVSVENVAALLGHSSTRITMKH